MRLDLTRCAVRSWDAADAASLRRHADDLDIWRRMRDAFPHPYTLEDAHRWLAAARERQPETYFAMEVDGQAGGGIGYTLHPDVERVSAEIGYWLGKALWGRGIVTEALAAVTAYAIRTHDLTRVYAVPFDGNPASCRVLEKAGYTIEGRMRRSAIKEGKVIDQLLYAYVVDP
jgi:RimJ/RimL family protein N-acetyltransferase